MRGAMLLVAGWALMMGVTFAEESGEGAEALGIKMGLGPDKTPYLKWDGDLSHSYMRSGVADWDNGAKVDAKFSEEFGKPEVLKLTLQVKLTKSDEYEVSGTYEAEKPFTLTLIGTGATRAEDKVLSFKAGDGKIAYSGKSPELIDKDADHPKNAPKGSLAITLAMDPESVPFLEWPKGLGHSYSRSGKADWDMGSTINAEIGREIGDQDLKLKLLVKLAKDGAYTINGTYEATEPFTLVLKGTAKERKDDVRLKLETGSGKVDYTGKVAETFKDK